MTIPRTIVWLGLCATLLLTQCGREAPNASAPPKDERSRELEAFTSGHTRVVWSQSASRRRADPFVIGERMLLMGYDSRDGRGERRILELPGNYSRPLLSTDGEHIYYTDKQVSRDEKIKSFDPLIYRTDWKGSPPMPMGRGYACDIWTDPKTGIEWIYAVKGLRSSKSLTLGASQLLRYPVKMPGPGVVLLDNTDLCPDNIQVSHSGHAISAQAPWPKAGLFKTERDGSLRFLKRNHGCWTSIAPDDSELLWTLDGNHMDLQMVKRDAAEEWKLRIANPSVMGEGEIYHPRWSNHARFFALTGPYRMEEANPNISVINNGGEKAAVWMARLSGDAHRVEAWLRISTGEGGCAYPDVWIDGGEEARLDETLYALHPTHE